MKSLEDSRINTSAGRSSAKFLLFFLFLAIIAISAYEAYAWHQRNADNLNKQITELTVQKDKLSREAAGLKSQLDVEKKQSDLPSTIFTSTGGIKIKLFFPESNSKVVSPLAVVGEVPGNWSSEASFPVLLKNSKGNVVAQGSAQVLGDWMSDQLVPFSVKLTYASAQSGDGSLILQKDNPSGLAKNDDSVSIPVKF